MNLAKVIGHATATLKHETLKGRCLLAVQPLDIRDEPEGDPLLAVDELGARRGDRVILTSDGAAVRQILNSPNAPVRWAVIGVADQ